MTLLRRAGFTATGALAGMTGGVFTVTASYVLIDIFVNGATNVEDLKLRDGKTQREQEIMKALDIASFGGGVCGGLVGLKFGNIPQFSFLRLLGITTGGLAAGGVFTVAATLAASHIINTINEEANTPKNS